MGTGKSAVGRGVAARTGLRFVDSDHAIAEQQGMTIAEIFERRGEEYFRQLERTFIEEGHPSSGCLVSCGGGLAAREGMVELLRSRGVVGALFASIETILARTAGNRNRPLLNVADPAEAVRNLMAAREKYYLQANFCISTDQRSLADVIQSVQRNYQRLARSASNRSQG